MLGYKRFFKYGMKLLPMCHKCFILHLDTHFLWSALFSCQNIMHNYSYKIEYTVCIKSQLFMTNILEHISRITFQTFLMSIPVPSKPCLNISKHIQKIKVIWPKKRSLRTFTYLLMSCCCVHAVFSKVYLNARTWHLNISLA